MGSMLWILWLLWVRDLNRCRGGLACSCVCSRLDAHSCLHGRTHAFPKILILVGEHSCIPTCTSQSHPGLMKYSCAWNAQIAVQMKPPMSFKKED